MGLMTRVKQAIGGGSNTESGRGDEEEQEGEPSHVCRSCGEEYYTDPDTEIEKCRRCGGIKVERA
jgi:ribosomal protein L37AE/L43A